MNGRFVGLLRLAVSLHCVRHRHVGDLAGPGTQFEGRFKSNLHPPLEDGGRKARLPQRRMLETRRAVSGPCQPNVGKHVLLALYVDVGHGTGYAAPEDLRGDFVRFLHEEIVGRRAVRARLASGVVPKGRCRAHVRGRDLHGEYRALGVWVVGKLTDDPVERDGAIVDGGGLDAHHLRGVITGNGGDRNA